MLRLVLVWQSVFLMGVAFMGYISGGPSGYWVSFGTGMRIVVFSIFLSVYFASLDKEFSFGRIKVFFFASIVGVLVCLQSSLSFYGMGMINFFGIYGAKVVLCLLVVFSSSFMARWLVFVRRPGL